MARKSKKWSEVVLRQAIGEAIYSRYLQNKPIDREAIKRRYLGRCPEHSELIKDFVDSYASQLERQPRGRDRVEITISAPDPSLSSASSTLDGSEIQAQSCLALVSQKSPPTKASASSQQARKIGRRYTQDEMQTSTFNSVAGSFGDEGNERDLVNFRLQEFKEDLAGSGDSRADDDAVLLPSLQTQLQFLSSTENSGTCRRNTPLKHAILFSPMLENNGVALPSQCALLGSIFVPGSSHMDPRVMLNTNIPFSAFVCGVQGSGKSHTTACMIENCSITMPVLGTLREPVSTLVLHFDEYTSTVSSQPSEAAFIARILPQFAHEKPVPVQVLVSPTNFQNLRKLYAQIPNIEVRPFKIQPKHLNIGMMLSLMSVCQGGVIPLYMAQVTRVLREMAIEGGSHFDYFDFRNRLKALKLDRSQTPFLHQRLDLLDSYLDIGGKEKKEGYFVETGVTILDLSCPFVDQGTACTLFGIAMDLFLGAHPSRGKMIVADEAHKYMADSPGSMVLTETFLTIIRLQRHLGVRVIISTQELTISPRLIDLCSLTIIHRFTSPEWYRTIKSHVPMEDGYNEQEIEHRSNGLLKIAGLQTGEAIIFAPSAHLVKGDDKVIDTKYKPFKMRIRDRVTWDGGKSILCIR